MHKIALIFGSIAGVITGGMFFATHLDGEINFDEGQLSGYIIMIVALSSIFFAVRQYRTHYSGGNISFGKALVVGLYVTLIASVIYVASWELYSATMDGNFADQYMTYLEESLAEKGLSQEEIKLQLAEDAEMMEMYKTNAAFRLILTFLEIFPVGLIISLVTAALFSFFLKPKERLTT